ncbi:MAG: hypothetical protein K2G12_08705, partial [Prevotella sp.]|nr:hypothetical protein [Prevotella sp.]
MPFPSAQEPAVLSEWGYTAERMAGAPTITGSLMHSMCLDDLWSKREYVEFNGERYFVDQIPTSSKNTDDARYSHEITLTSERIVLENVYFFDVVTSETEAQYKDRYRSNGTTFSFYGTLQELVARLNDSLIYTKLYDVATNKGYQVIIDEGVSITEEKEISLENVYFATALQEIYTKFEVPYYWVGTTCHVGYAENSITIPFEYGLGNGLLSVTKTNENYRIINRITGVGSSDNIPYYYPNTNPEGTAIFETVNIDKEKVRDIFLSKVLQYNTDIYPSTYTLTYNPPKFSFSLSLAKDGFAIYSAKTYYEEDVNDIEKRFVAEGSVLITILVHLTSGTVLKDYLMTATAGTKDPRTVRIDKSSYQTVITEYRYFDDDTYFGRLKPISSSYTITEEDNYLVGVKLDYKISRRLYKEDIGDPADYLTVSAGGFLNVIYKPNGFTGYGFRYGNGSVMPYEDGGIYLHDVQNAPCTRYKYELKKEDINPQYSKYSVETLIDEASSSDYPAQVIIIDRAWVTPTSALMPPIYRESNGGERFYNAQNNTYENPDGGKYIFSNPYTESNPLEGIQNFEDIKPSIKGMKNSMGQLLGEIADIAFDSDDSDEIDDNGDYVHSYFYVKLHVYNGTYGFNLFKQATASGAMTFNMTSGNCAPCAFEVGVSQPKLVEGHYEFENPVQVDENGDIVSGSYNDKVNFNNIQPRQQDTSVYEVWVALKKEIDTFGVVMPNVTNNYKPSVGDTFVVTNILMPDVYITNAENELKNALIKYMSENNDEKFSFNITLSRIYLQRNSDIVSMLNENARLIVRYNEHDYTLYVSSYSCKATDDILYEITVDVTSEFSVGQSMLRDKIAEVTHEVIGGGRAALDYLALAQKHFLSKRQRDRAKHKITFEEGIDYGDYVPAVQGGFIDGKGNAELLTLVVRDLLRSPVLRDGFGGEGWQIWMEDALSHLTIDKL